MVVNGSQQPPVSSFSQKQGRGNRGKVSQQIRTVASAPSPSEHVDPQNPYPMPNYLENTLAYPSALRLGMTLRVSFPDLHLGFPNLQNCLGQTWTLTSVFWPLDAPPGSQLASKGWLELLRIHS